MNIHCKQQKKRGERKRKKEREKRYAMFFLCSTIKSLKTGMP